MDVPIARGSSSFENKSTARNSPLPELALPEATKGGRDFTSSDYSRFAIRNC